MPTILLWNGYRLFFFSNEGTSFGVGRLKTLIPWSRLYETTWTYSGGNGMSVSALEEAYIISGGCSGLHWEDLDEDISVDGPLLGVGDRSRT